MLFCKMIRVLGIRKGMRVWVKGMIYEILQIYTGRFLPAPVCQVLEIVRVSKLGYNIPVILASGPSRYGPITGIDPINLPHPSAHSS